MPTTALHGWPVPASTQAPAGAAQMLALASAIDGDAPLAVTTEADRDTRFGTLTKGIVYTTQAPWKVWLRTGSTWAEVYSDTGDVTNLLTPDESEGLTVQIQHCRVRQGWASLAVNILDTTGVTSGATSGNIGNRIFGSIPQEYCPVYVASLSTCNVGPGLFACVQNDGRAQVTASTEVMAANTTYTLQGSWPVKP